MMADQCEESKEKMAAAHVSGENGDEVEREARGGDKEDRNWGDAEMKGEDGSGEEEDGSGEEEDGSGEEEDGSGEEEDGSGKEEDGSGEEEDGSGEEEDGSDRYDSDGMGMTVKACGEDAAPQTVVLASKFKKADCGHGDVGDDDAVDDDENSYSEDDEDEVDDDDMFNDDVDNLYDAYKSVLATDSNDLDPLDTSVLEDPYADLPPICEDDELGSSEFSKSVGESMEESIGFEDSNAQTVLPAFSKDMLAMQNSGSQLGTDELGSKKIAVSGSTEHEVSESDQVGSGELSDTSGGMVVAEGKVSQLLETGLIVATKDTGDTMDSGGPRINVAEESQSDMTVRTDDVHVANTNTVVAMDTASKGRQQKIIETKDTIITEATEEEVTVISRGVTRNAAEVDVMDGGVGETTGKDEDEITGVMGQHPQTTVELPSDLPMVMEVRDLSSMKDVAEAADKKSLNNDESFETSTQDQNVEEKHVEETTATLETTATKGDDSVKQDELAECKDEEAINGESQVEEHGQVAGDKDADDQIEDSQPGLLSSLAESQDSQDSQSEENGRPVANEDAGGQINDSQLGPLTLQAESLDSQVEATRHKEVEATRDEDVEATRDEDVEATRDKDVETTRDEDVEAMHDEDVEAAHDSELQTEAKYDSGCESERSEQTVSYQSVEGGQASASLLTEADHGHDAELEEDQAHAFKNYPDFIDTCEEKLKVHYVSCYAKEAPIDWFHVPNKPTHRIFTNVNLMERNGRRHNQVLTFDLLNFEPGLRMLIEGRAGMGKSTLIHRIAYDYGLGILVPLQRFKLVFVIDVLKWSREQELHDVILEQAVQADAWGVEADDLFDWMQNNPEDVIFFIDGLDEHPGFPASHSLLSLAQGELYPNSTVVFTTQPNRVFEITDCCQKFYVMQKFTEKQVNGFMDSFVEGKDSELDALKLDLVKERNVADFYKVPLHLALLCTLFQNGEIIENGPIPSTLTELFDKVFVYTLRQLVADRRVDAQKELELSMFEDMAFVLTRLALSCLQEDTVSLSKSQLVSEQEIDDDLLDAFIQYGLLEKVVCRDAYFFPYKLFQEFLAAKFIAIEYFSAANSGQIGVVQDMKHVRELFELCWSCYADGYKYEDLCVFTSGLLAHDYNQFVDALCKQYNQAPDDPAREMCVNVACACISENASNRGFISLMVDSLSPKGDLSLDISTDDASGPHLLGISHMLVADKLPKLSLVNFNPSDTEALRSVASAIAGTERLRSLEIDFTNLDPTINGMPKLKDGTDDFSLLKQFVKGISMNSSIRDLGLKLNVDMMCLQGVEVVSGLFLNVLADLKSLGVHVHFDNTSSYFQNCPIIKESIASYENLNLLVSRFSVFLQNNSMLEKLELNGCFLHRDALPELKHSIINHQYLRAISLAGQKEGAPLHREGTNALAEILLRKNFDEVALDLNSFLMRQPDKYNLKDNCVKFDTMQFENELIIAKLLKAMQGNGKLKRVKLACCQIDCDLLDHVADFVEECSSLTTLEISCEEMDDLFMLFLGCGILCSVMLESLTLRGKFDSGGATFLLVQSCVMSLALKSVKLSGSFSQDCIDWLAVSLPNLNIQCTHPMTLTLQGQIDEGETDSVLESIEQLKDCVLPLDLLLETDFKM